MNELQVKKLLKALIPIKIIVVIGIFAYLGRHLTIGEKALNAEVDSPSRPVDTPTPDQKIPQKKVAAAEKTVVRKPESSERKSFLDGILNLPEIGDGASKTEEIGKYLSLAERKKQQVEERLDILETRESQLKKIEGIIDEKLARLEDERLFFSQTVQKEKVVQADRLETLVNLYAKMDPKKAGPVFENLDKDLVVALFNKLEKKTVTRILEVVTAPRSVELTEYFGRIRSGKEYDILKEMNVSLRSAFDECKGLPAAGAEPAEIPPVTTTE